MNNINELAQLIRKHGGAASTEEIVKNYCRKHRMIAFSNYRSVVEHILTAKPQSVRRNAATRQWELNTDGLVYLYASEKRFFSSPRDAMMQIFDKSVANAGGYFRVDAEHMAWFPQPKNDDWENTFSDDGRFWYERPKTDSADYEPDNLLRYVFKKESGGWRFTGLFKVNGMAEGKTRVYELIDDKVRIVSLHN